MKDRKSKLKQTIDFVDMNGVGTVRIRGFRDVMVYMGTFIDTIGFYCPSGCGISRLLHSK